MDLQGIMLNEISQTEKGKYYMITLLCWILRKNKTKQNKLIGKKLDLWLPEEEGGELEDGWKAQISCYKINKY